MGLELDNPFSLMPCLMNECPCMCDDCRFSQTERDSGANEPAYNSDEVKVRVTRLNLSSPNRNSASFVTLLGRFLAGSVIQGFDSHTSN